MSFITEQIIKMNFKNTEAKVNKMTNTHGSVKNNYLFPSNSIVS